MSKQPVLSVICIFHNQAGTIESTLSALYNIENIRVEVIIVDDGSTDESRQIIQSLLDYYQHEDTYYYEHDEQFGTGQCLGEVLEQVSGSYIWIVHDLEAVDSEMLIESLETMHETNSLAMVQSDSFLLESYSPDVWAEAILSGDALTPNHDIILNWSACQPSGRFFDPFLSGFHCLEWIIRSGDEARLLPVGSWYSEPAGPDNDAIDPRDKSELLFSLLRRLDTSDPQNADLLKDIAGLVSGFEEESPSIGDDTAEDFDDFLHESDPLDEDEDSDVAFELIQGKEIEEEEDIQEPDETEPVDIRYSVIIPTTADRKPLLEESLINLNEYADPTRTELIVIDNASLDDTFEYLEQLQSDHFFNCRIIRNAQNVGFAASVNQGIEAATGSYICVMHNDVHFTSDIFAEMAQLLDDYPDFGVIGPRTDNTLNPEQNIGDETSDYGEDLTEAGYLDSFCIMFRGDLDLRFDEQFQLAYFEDVDFSLTAQREGLKLGIVNHIEVNHDYALTTRELGLEPEQAYYWENLSRFNEKWDIRPPFPEEHMDDDVTERLLILSRMMNPVYPEPYLMELFEEWFTSETKTRILENDWDADIMFEFVRLMMKTDQRDVLRELEEKLEEKDIPENLLRDLTEFYFIRNIFSRCRHYIGELNAEVVPFYFRLVELKMAVVEKDMVTAIPLLNELLNDWPANPELYKLSGDLHLLEGNEKAARQFFDLAMQLDPFHYSPRKEHPDISEEMNEESDS